MKTVNIFLRQNLPQIFLSLLTVVASPSASAFINVESLRQEDTEGLLGTGAIDANGQQGNTNKLSLSGTTLTIDRGSRDEILFLANAQYGATAGIQDTNNGQAHLRYTFFDRTPRAVEIFMQQEYDQFKNLLSRTLGGADLRERLVKNPTTAVFVGLGAFYEFESYTLGLNHQGMRGSFYASFAEKLDERLQSSATFYYQPLFSNISDFRIRFHGELDVSLRKQLSLNLVYAYNYDAWVPPNILQTDMSYLLGFKVKY